jgi:hypothetical protein
MNASELPVGCAPDALEVSHFPDRLHAFVWRNWQLVPAERMAKVVGAEPEQVRGIGRSLGLSDQPVISEQQQRRTYVTILRRNWHLLPYDQLCELLDWSPEKLGYALREGDGLFWWFGGHKPQVEPLRYAAPADTARARAVGIASIVRETFPDGVGCPRDPLFSFVARLSEPPAAETERPEAGVFSPRFCYSYYASFRNPLSGEEDPWPEGYLARLAGKGVDGVILHEPLYHLTPFPWDPSVSEGHEARLERLCAIVARARAHGIGVYLYMNEPRPMPMALFDGHPELKGVEDVDVIAGQQATLCTSVPAVQDYLRDGFAALCEAVPDLGGIFTITASESYTNCWSHHHGERCERCAARSPEEVIAEVGACIRDGITRSGSACKLIMWDWGWADAWAEGIIQRLPKEAYLMSVSEWSLPIERGGVESIVGEYSLSSVGPGPRATRHWKLARENGLRTLAKVQMSNCWELAAAPYIPVVENVANHMANLRGAGVEGLMLSWTLGSYPSPSFDTATEMSRKDAPSVGDAMRAVAERRFGSTAATAVVDAWRAFSAAIREYPFHINVVYYSPVHMGPANLLWGESTGYQGIGTMAFAHPLDDLDTWRSIYPPDVFAEQFRKVAEGFDQAVAGLKGATVALELAAPHRAALSEELDVAEACAIHFRSVANQSRFVMARDELAGGCASERAASLLDELETLLTSELDLATRLFAIQNRDARIGFEAACQYFYVGVDLVEKVVNCRDLLTRWLPMQRARYNGCT